MKCDRRCSCFGQNGEDLSSEFHNDLYQFLLDKRRWFAAEMRPPAKKSSGQQQQGAEDPESSAGEAIGRLIKGVIGEALNPSQSVMVPENQ